MFINNIFLYFGNVRSRTSRRTIENSTCRGETTRGKRKWSYRVQAGSRKGYNFGGIEKDSRELCKQVEQYQQYPKAKGNKWNSWEKGKELGNSWTKSKEFLTLLYLFILYNPNILITAIYIDSMFMDELINISSMRLVGMYYDIQRFNILGVV